VRSCRSGLPKRYKLPLPIRHRCLMTENVQVAVVGPKLEEEIQFKNDVRSELERAKQEMERAHEEYRRTLEHYNALKRRVESAESSSPNGKLKPFWLISRPSEST
jgi:hypothetical protein